MAARKTTMDRLQELVRLHRLGTGTRESARLLKMSPNTERKYREALQAAGLYDRESIHSESRRSATLLSASRIRDFVEIAMPKDMHKKRVDSLENATQGAIAAASLSVTAIGSGYAVLQGGDPKHGVKQVDLASGRPICDVRGG